MDLEETEYGENVAQQTLEEELADNIEDIEEDLEFIKESESIRKPQEKTFSTTQIKSYIAILTSALGGVDHTSEIQPPPYKLGDEALLCLQDIKKWLRTYDNERHSWAVAVACAESGLVKDLVTILTLWEETSTAKSTISGYTKDYDAKIARICLELLIVLTWPIELADGMYRDQLDNYIELKKHQLSYKKMLLTYKGGSALKAVIKIALPILAVEPKERRPSDHGILRFCITFFRNIISIEPAGISKISQKANHQGELNDNLPSDVRLDDISIGACIGSFENNMVFTFLLTVCSSLGNELETNSLSPVLLEVIYYFTRRIRPQYIMSQDSNKIEKAEKSATGLDLGDLLSKEKEMKTTFKKSTSSRHGAFGTLLSLQTPDMGRLTVSGSANMLSSNNPVAAFDSRKPWHKPVRFKYQVDEEVIFPEITVGANNKKVFHSFVCDFIDGVLNPFMELCTKSFTGGDEMNKTTQDKIRYLSIISWFLEAQRLRYGSDISGINYSLVGNVLSENAFRLIFGFLRESFETNGKQWGVAHAGLIAIKEIIYIIDTMSLSTDMEYKDIATNIKERLFHKESYVDIISIFPKEASKRAPEFIDTCVELNDILLKTLEAYSREDLVETIKNKKSRKIKKNYTNEQLEIDSIEDDEESIQTLAQSLSESRAKTFKHIQKQFINPGSIDTYIQYLTRYRDLSERALKRAIKFLHKAFFESKRQDLLYRLDFLLLLHSMLSEDGLSKASRIRTHISQFLHHYMKKLKSTLDKTPVAYVELLFTNSSGKDAVHYINTGEALIEEKKQTYVKHIAMIKDADSMDLETKVSIMVAALIDDDRRDLVQYLSEELERIVTLRMQQLKYDVPPNQEEESEVPEESSVKSIAIYSPVTSFMRSLVDQPKVRYLLKLADFKLPSNTGVDCIFGKEADLDRLNEVLTKIKLFLFQPVPFADGKVASDYIIIKKIGDDYDKHNQDLEDFDEDDFLVNNGYSEDEEIAFEIDGTRKETTGYNDDELDKIEEAIDRAAEDLPRGVARSKNKGIARSKKSSSSSKSSDSKKQKRRLRKEDGDPLPMHELSDDENQEKRHAEAKGPISSKYIVDSDEESDDESDKLFFARERLLRQLLNQNNGLLSTDQIKSFIHRQVTTSQIDQEIEDSIEATETTKATSVVLEHASINNVELSDDEFDGNAGLKDVQLSDDENDGLKRAAENLEAPQIKRRNVIADSESEEENVFSDPDEEVKDSDDDKSQDDGELSEESNDDIDSQNSQEAITTTTTPRQSVSPTELSQKDVNVVDTEDNDAADEDFEHTSVVRRKARVIFEDDEDDE